MAQIDKLVRQLGIQNFAVGSEEDSLLSDILDSAKSAILSRRYPLSDFPVDTDGNTILESRYFDLQIRIAVCMYNKQGAEGQTAHSENGINRSYESADIPKSLLDEVIPFVGTFSNVVISE